MVQERLALLRPKCEETKRPENHRLSVVHSFGCSELCFVTKASLRRRRRLSLVCERSEFGWFGGGGLKGSSLNTDLAWGRESPRMSLFESFCKEITSHFGGWVMQEMQAALFVSLGVGKRGNRLKDRVQCSLSD